MSSRRTSKRVASQPDACGTELKKTRVSDPEIDGFRIRFEWEGDGDEWVRYSKEFNSLLADEFNSKKNKVELTVSGGNKMIVLFDKMVQRNKRTGWERRIRICVKGKKDSDFMTTAWQDESNNWCSYSVETSIEVAKAFGKGKTSIETETTPTPYKLDMKNMTQSNAKTGFSRKFKRHVAVSDIPPEDEENDCSNTDQKKSAAKSAKLKKSSSLDTEVKKETNEDEEDVKLKNGNKKASKSAAKSAKKKKEIKEEIDDDEEEEEIKPKSKSGRAKSTKSTVRTVVVKKGCAPVDDKCPVAEKTSVYQSGKVIWDCMLNQTNIANNNNKYFLLQLLKEDDKNNYYVWFRWGRVGYDGQNKLNNCGGSLDAAMKMFEKKFSDKTKNNWNLKHQFEKVPGKYDLLQMDYSNDKNEDESVKKEIEDEVKVPESKLDEKLQKLIKLICDVKSMEDAVVEMKYDAKKVPLGKLTKDQIKAGYTALKKIDALISKDDTGRNLSDACSEFYTRIPHEFGMQVPPVIRTKQMVKKKIELLEALEDIEIAIKMLKGGDKSENPVDRNYHQLDCKLTTMDHESDEFKLINKYLQQTHAATHFQYKMELLDVYCCEKTGEASQFTDLGNRMLLWHGSRLTNWAGILGKGLRIAPPEAPITGYMFGKGVYFADMSSKSANYCFATKTKNVGLMMLCDVSLGNTEDKLAADYDAAKLPKGKNSARGLGKVAPDPKENVTLSDGVVMPLGKGSDTGVNNPAGYTLNYNEFIVYDTRQIMMKYLLQVKFVFK